jgi:hypothetical protein
MGSLFNQIWTKYSLNFHLFPFNHAGSSTEHYCCMLKYNTLNLYKTSITETKLTPTTGGMGEMVLFVNVVAICSAQSV